MATDQGKTSNMNALAIVAGLTASASAAGRPHHVPHALHAGDVRRACRHRARRSVRAGAPHADPRLGRSAGCGVRECRHLAARPLLPARRRGHAPRRRARMPRRAQRGRHVRRHHARQDRSGRTRRGGVPQPSVYRQLYAARPGPLPLWRAAERGRLRDGRRRRRPSGAGSLPRHHDDRRRGRACCITWKTICRPNFPNCACG